MLARILVSDLVQLAIVYLAIIGALSLLIRRLVAVIHGLRFGEIYRGGKPRCAQCRYIIAPGASSRCPECGTELRRSGVLAPHVIPPAHPWEKVFAAAMLLLPLCWWLGDAASLEYPLVGWYEAHAVIPVPSTVAGPLGPTNVRVIAKGKTEIWNRRADSIDVQWESSHVVVHGITVQWPDLRLRDGMSRGYPVGAEDRPDWAFTFLSANNAPVATADARAFAARLHEVVNDFERERFPPMAAPDVWHLPPASSATVYHAKESAPVFIIVPLWFISIAAVVPSIWRGHRRRYAAFVAESQRVLDRLEIPALRQAHSPDQAHAAKS